MHRAIQVVSLFTLLAVVALRPLVGETYDSAGDAMSQALGGLTDPTPVRTLVFDLLILCSACGLFIARAIGPVSRYRRTGLEWGAIIVLIGAIASCIVAGQKRLAITASIDWMCYLVLTITLVQLMRRPWQRRLLLAAVLATATAQAVQCVLQYYWGFDDTYAYYESIKEQFWFRQGVDLDSSKVAMFEGRLNAREASGFFAHSNVAASHMLLCGFAAIGFVIARLRCWSRMTPGGQLATIAAVALSALLLFAVGLTGSLGAIVAGTAGLVLGVLIHTGRRWIERNRVRALTIGWLVFLGGAGAAVTHGLYHDSLPGVSLTFRWQYWKASSELITDHPLTGVGRENFGRHYLQHKAIESPEEIANPHNLFVQSAADWGVLGLIGVAMMMIGASRRVAGIFRQRDVTNLEETNALDPPISPGLLAASVVALALTVNIARLALLGTTDPDYLYYTGVVTTLSWVIALAAFLPCPESPSSPRPPSTYSVATGVAIGLFTFLLHDMINFAIFVPASATTFFALLAYCLAERNAQQIPIREPKPSRDCSQQSRDREGAEFSEPQALACATPRKPSAARANKFAHATRSGADQRADRRASRWAPAGVAVLTAIAIALGGFLPVCRSTALLKTARQQTAVPIAGPIDAHSANKMFLRAADADPLDATASMDRAAWLVGVTASLQDADQRMAAFRLAVRSIDEAVRRDPFNLRPRRMRIQLHRAMADTSNTIEHDEAAIHAAEEALAIYPLDPDVWIVLGDCQADAADRSKSQSMRERAAASYERALELDDQRLEWETLRRLPSARRAEIENTIHRIRGE